MRRQGKLDESLRFFEQALAATDDDEHLYFNTGQVYSQMGNREAARPLLIKALELNPDFTEAAELLEKINRS
ncbi:MAG: tetratricopeptide repeat protein [Deltaproteobacteria bacterium]|nr:tetratricopeptide repeat protein [Deltaproteobacteria bacterium]